MTDHTDVARRFDTYDDQVLIDYFPVHMPCQLLVIDVIGLEHRAVPALTEFCIRAIEAGMRTELELSGFLGINHAYCADLLRELCDGEYVGRDAFARFVTLRRGQELLREGCESSPVDRRIQGIWDPVCSTLLGRTLVYTRKRAGPEGIVAPIPGGFAAPAASQLDVRELSQAWTNARAGRSGAHVGFHVIRATRIVKSFGRYREVLALVYKGNGGEHSLRLASRGAIELDLTRACAEMELAKGIGIDRHLSSRGGSLAVRKRHRELATDSAKSVNIDSLVQRRSVLLFNLDALNARLAEEYVEAVETRKRQYEVELGALSEQLKSIPVVPVRCHEGRHYLKLALATAQKSVTITTTIPQESKIDGELLGLMRECLSRGVGITIYISDRLGDHDGSLAQLDRLSRSHGLTVNFLQNDTRPVFEIEWDGENLAVSNEPSLGWRRLPAAPREFSGFYASGFATVSAYAKQHLSFATSDLMLRVKPTPERLDRKNPGARRPRRK